MKNEVIKILEEAEIKPTSNRIIVLSKLMESKSPMSLVELETELETLERSSIFRVLVVLLEHDIVHSIEDGRGITKYEICHGEHCCSIDDMHAHFYCEKCEKVFCFEDIRAPRLKIPGDFKIRSVNYMLKGLCPACSNKGV